MSMGALVGFLCLSQVSSVLQNKVHFEYQMIILSSKLTTNEIGTYKAKWLQMETVKDFTNLKTAMEQDAKKHHLKLRQTSIVF
jgi:hypothetical protein